MNLSPFEILIIGVMIVVAARLFSRLRGGGDSDRNRPPNHRGHSGQGEQDQQDRDALLERQRADAYERARQAWGYLSSDPNQKPESGQTEPPPSNLELPEDFDYGDFINGAKAMYARIKDSWYKRDLDDIQEFTTDQAFGELNRRAEREPRPGRIDILLIEAKMVEFRDQGPVQRARVFYDVLVKRGTSDASEKIQEVWEFVEGGAYGDSWKLDDMKAVDEVMGGHAQ
jgi:predicted lipid-binding transport protein (Tim44 family)